MFYSNKYFNLFKVFFIIPSSLVLANCTSGGQSASDIFGERSLFGVEDDEQFSKVNLVELVFNSNLQYDGDTNQYDGDTNQYDGDTNQYDGDTNQVYSIEEALGSFYNNYYEKLDEIDPENDAVKLKTLNNIYSLKRNRIQDRLLAASNENCGKFFAELRGSQANFNFGFGVVATGAAGAATIVSGLEATRILAGIAGVVTGIRAEFNQEYYQSLGVEVITKGIESRRDKVLASIDRSRVNIVKAKASNNYESSTIMEYTLERAIADALIYHSSCQITVGLEEASTEIDGENEKDNTSSFEEMNKVLNRFDLKLSVDESDNPVGEVNDADNAH